jgi:hypothetical protein
MVMYEDQSSPGFAQFGRLLWIALGPGVLAISAMYIFLEGTGWYTPADYVFFTALAAMILGRWLEVLGGHPLTGVGEPATPQDFHRYIVVALIAGLSLWIVVNALGNQGRS